MNYLHRNANRVIVIDTIVYLALLVLAFLYISLMNFSGDAAGRGMASGYVMILGNTIFGILGLVLTVLHLILLKSVTIQWIKYIVYAQVFLLFGSPIIVWWLLTGAFPW
jgi:hypothetical protein